MCHSLHVNCSFLKYKFLRASGDSSVLGTNLGIIVPVPSGPWFYPTETIYSRQFLVLELEHSENIVYI